MISSEAGHSECVRVLAQAGADLHVSSSTLLSLLLSYSQPGTLLLLLTTTCYCSYLFRIPILVGGHQLTTLHKPGVSVPSQLCQAIELTSLSQVIPTTTRLYTSQPLYPIS